MLLSTNIVRIRKEAGINQTELAAKAGITRKHLCSIEKGKTFPSSTILDQIARALEVPVENLFRDLDNPGIENERIKKLDRILERLAEEAKAEIRKI